MMSLMPGIVYHCSLYFVLASSDFSLMGIITANCLISPLSAKTLKKPIYKFKLVAAAAHGGMQ